MSLIPPTPLINSKLKYHIKSRIRDPDEQLRILEMLGPYYEFKLTANFRSLINGTCNELDDIGSYIGAQQTVWDDIDHALNMFTRMKKFLLGSLESPGVLRLGICHRVECSSDPWSDMYVDEQPVNVRGIRDDKGNDLTLGKKPS